jgi:putative peptide zinc metalloprotease protein
MVPLEPEIRPAAGTVGLDIDIQELLDERIQAEPTEPDLYERLEEITDPVEFRPKLASDIEIKTFHLRWGNDYTLVANPRNSLILQPSLDEASIIPLMDGTRSVGELVVDRLQEEGDLDVGSVAGLVRLLHENGFLDPQPIDVDSMIDQALHPTDNLKSSVQAWIRNLRIDWSGAERLIQMLYRRALRPLFTPVGAVLTALLAVAGFVALVAVVRRGGEHFGSGSIIGSVLLFVISWTSTFSHEVAHAAVITHYGRRVHGAGFLLYFGSPAFFVDATDSLMLDRNKRILQSFAGPYAEMLLASVGTILLWFYPDSWFSPVLFTFAVIGYYEVCLNLIPLLELDGYWILSDFIQVPDLRPRSLQFIQHDLWHKLRTGEGFTRQEIGLGIYGLLGILFTILSIYVAILFWQAIVGDFLARLWSVGLWGRVVLLLVALILVGPIIRGLIALGRSLARRTRAIYRAIRFKFQTKWRIEAARMIDDLPVFDDLSGSLLSDLAGRVELVSVRAGEPVFRQGDRADAFYVVRSGFIEIEDAHPETGDRRVLQRLARGDSFGELGLLGSAPRAATARSVGESELFRVEKATFDRLLAEHIEAPEFGPTFQTLAELRSHPAFRHLGTKDLSALLDYGAWITASPGEELVREGEEGDAFFALVAGQVDVFVGEEWVRTLGAGTYFGEVALLQHVPRTATVVAKTPVRAYRLDRNGFDEIVAHSFRRGGLAASTELMKEL